MQLRFWWDEFRYLINKYKFESIIALAFVVAVAIIVFGIVAVKSRDSGLVACEKLGKTSTRVLAADFKNSRYGDIRQAAARFIAYDRQMSHTPKNDPNYMYFMLQEGASFYDLEDACAAHGAKVNDPLVNGRTA